MNRIQRAEWVRQHIMTRPDRAPRSERGALWIRCPNPDHKGGQERTPSLKINTEISQNARGYVGNFQCYGCGWRGDWNTLAATMGLPQWQGKTIGDGTLHGFPILPAEDELLTLNEELVDQESVPWPTSQDWRNIKGDLCSKLGGRMNLRGEELRLVFPVRVFDETLGTITCMLEKVKGEKSYINSRGDWAHVSMFPYDHVRGMFRRMRPGRRPVLVVEGPRDALTLVQAGIPALATIGSYTAWTEQKARLVLDLEPDLIVLAFDGDEIGQLATKVAARSFRGHARLRKLDFPEDEDPADLDSERMVWLKGQIGRWLPTSSGQR